MSSDIATVTQDRKFLTFMRSYPNFIPLSARDVEGIAAALAPFSFDRIYGHYFDRVIAADAKQVLQRSVARYLAAIDGTARREDRVRAGIPQDAGPRPTAARRQNQITPLWVSPPLML